MSTILVIIAWVASGLVEFQVHHIYPVEQSFLPPVIPGAEVSCFSFQGFLTEEQLMQEYLG